MSKLYPPNISGTLPAFYESTLTVPFAMNKAVSANEVVGFAIKIKTVNDNSLVYSGEEFNNYDLGTNGKVIFTLPLAKFQVGEFYKVQIAYIGQEKSGLSKIRTIGYYSTVGIVKYTTKPTVTIAGLEDTNINIHSYYYEGVYSQSRGSEYLDTTEKLYSSEFTLYDSKNNIIASSGEIIHDTSKDTNKYEATESFKISSDLKLSESFYLVYRIKTINGLEASSPRYRVAQRRLIPMMLKADLVAALDFENGAVRINLKSPSTQIASGDFVISKACSKDGYIWDEFKYFSLASEEPDKKVFMDYTVEQGVTYRYSIQQYNENGVYSNRQLSNDIFVDFEDSFLYDGTKQLRIRFNPKVSTFKNDMAETKTETIGSQYPFIFRNGKVKYKEFNISGLISYKMDEVETFMTLEDLGLTNRKDAIYSNGVTTNLVDYNISAERQFKLEVLDWLTNGQPKVFRSPTEGNYIVRLMNVSLAPEDKVGRMLHTFTCTAYEIAAFNYENLNTYHLIESNADPLTVMRWITVDLRQANKDSDEKVNTWIKLNKAPAYHISFTEMLPGSSFGLSSEDGRIEEYVIGATGSYFVNVKTPITGIYLKKQSVNLQGYLTYGYQTRATNTFDTITDMDSRDYPCVQFIGNKVLNYTFEKNLLTELVKEPESSRVSILHYYYIRFQKRELKTIYVSRAEVGGSNVSLQMLRNNQSYYLDGNQAEPISRETLVKDQHSLYEIRFTRDVDSIKINGELYYIDKNNDTYRPKSGYVLDCAADNVLVQTDNIFSVRTNGEIISLEETEELYLPSDYEPKDIGFGTGIVCELGYQSQITTYNFEQTNSDVVSAKNNYEAALADYLEKRLTSNAEAEAVTVKQAYAKYCVQLKKAIDEYNKENGVE